MSAPRTSATSKQLSQTDIDHMMRSGGVPTERPAGAPGTQRSSPDVQVYDFQRPHRVSKERLRTLEAMYGRLVKSFEGWLIGRVRGVVDLRLQSVEQISFGEYVLSLPASCNSFLLDIKDRAGDDAVGEQAVIDIGRELAYFLVDRLFGGGSETTILDRALTPIERLAVRVVAERIMSLVQEIWEDHVELELSLSGFESIPEIIQAAPREAPVLVTNIDATFGSNSSLISICLPLSVLEKFFAMSSSKTTAQSPRRELAGQRAITEGALRATHIDVSARLPDFRLSMRDIAGLKVGSMLSTGIPVDSNVNLLVGNQARFKTAPGRVGRKLAVRVVETLNAGPPPVLLGRPLMNQADIDALTAAGQGQRTPELAELGNGVTSSSEVPLAMLMDLTLPLSIELGRTRMTVQDILRLGRGSVVQLERLAGEPIDLYVADRRFAEGEVVVLGEHFGVRITRIISSLAIPEGNA